MRRTLRVRHRLAPSETKGAVRRGTVTITAGNTSATAAILAVDVNHAVIDHLGESWDTDGVVDERSGVGRVDLTNGTTVTAYRQGSTGSLTIAFEVREAMPGILETVRRGTIALNGVASNTAGLSPAVDAVRGEVTLLGVVSNDGFGYGARHRIRLELSTDGATVTATRGNATNNMTVGYQVAVRR